MVIVLLHQWAVIFQMTMIVYDIAGNIWKCCADWHGDTLAHACIGFTTGCQFCI